MLLESTKPPQAIDERYRAPIPGTQEGWVYERYYLTYCDRAGIPPMTFEKWLGLQDITISYNVGGVQQALKMDEGTHAKN